MKYEISKRDRGAVSQASDCVNGPNLKRAISDNALFQCFSNIHVTSFMQFQSDSFDFEAITL